MVIHTRWYLLQSKCNSQERSEFTSILLAQVGHFFHIISERAVTTSDGNVTFQGIFDALSIPGEDKSILYLGDGNTLYYPDASMTIGAFHAYFQLNGDLTVGDASSDINVFVLNFDGEETGINSTLVSSESVGDGHWYDLSGRKVADASLTTPRSSLSKGIYIHNGKKIVVK